MPAATGTPAKMEFEMATDWSEEAKARRSVSAKKAARTRALNKLNAELDKPIPAIRIYPYIQNSRVARWALSGVSLIAMMRGARHVRWGRPTMMLRQTSDVAFPNGPAILRG